MMTDLRVGFKERHHKCLHEAIEVDASPTKRTCSKGVQGEPKKDASPEPMPSSDVTGSSSVLAVGKEACPTQDGAPGGPAHVEEDLDQKDASVSVLFLSWEEMMEMLRWVPCFIDAEPPSTKMSNFFPLTKRILMNIGGDPPIFVSARLPFGMPEFAVARIQQL